VTKLNVVLVDDLILSPRAIVFGEETNESVDGLILLLEFWENSKKYVFIVILNDEQKKKKKKKHTFFFCRFFPEYT
jgi:hypothetical protein